MLYEITPKLKEFIFKELEVRSIKKINIESTIIMVG